MKKVILMLMICAAVCTGCSKKEYLYLADMTDSAGYAVANRYQSRIQSDDRLRIHVICKTPELAAPFNVNTGNVNVSTNGQVSAVRGGDSDTYRVNVDGDINFPILGEIHVAGLSLQQAAEHIEDLIIEGNYIKDPIVTVEFVNFHYTVLGAVGGNGSYSVDGDKVTILEAIAKSGDLSENADLHNISVIREADGERRIYTMDITNTDIFNSPAFYLAQNDIIYARPKRPKDSSRTPVTTWLSIALSAISTACTLTWYITRK